MREVIRFEKDGRFAIAPDITDEEMRAVFPNLVRLAANLQAAVNRLAPNMVIGDWKEINDGGKRGS
jgi:hypothetical protein